MNDVKKNYKNIIGINGENKILDRLKTRGFCLYKRNVKYGYGEIDLIIYRFNRNINKIEIRIVEVKTRKRSILDLVYLNMNSKWRNIRPYIFKIKDDLIRDTGLADNTFVDIHFDLGFVNYIDSEYKICGYIEDVNLMI